MKQWQTGLANCWEAEKLKLCTKLIYSIYSCHLANKTREGGQCKQPVLWSLYWHSSAERFKWMKLLFSYSFKTFSFPSISKPNPPIIQTHQNCSSMLCQIFGVHRLLAEVNYGDTLPQVKKGSNFSLLKIYFVWQNMVEIHSHTSLAPH